MTEIKNIRKNCMGTTSFEMKIKGMRKFQDFIIYPMQRNDSNEYLLIQSKTRIGQIFEGGKGVISKSHPSGAYSPHLVLDKLTNFELQPVDWQALKMFIFTTQGSKVGNNAMRIYSDNSRAVNIFDL